MNKMILLCVAAVLLSGCGSVEIRPEEICGTYRQFAVDIGRSGREAPMDGLYCIFLPDGTYRSEIRKQHRTEIYPGKWRIVGEKIETQNDKGIVVLWQYDPDSGRLTHTAYEKTFFPRGVKFILEKENGNP